MPIRNQNGGSTVKTAWQEQQATSQLRSFGLALFEPHDIVEVRWLPGARSVWLRAAGLPALAGRLSEINHAGQDVYVGANPRTRVGGRRSADVQLARCVFADLDATTLSSAVVRMRSAGLPQPTATINSGHGVHLWWRLTEPLKNLGIWSELQQALAVALRSDLAVHDPPRLMRLPGLVNHKSPPARCELVECDAARRYEIAAITQRLPRASAERVGRDEPVTHAAATRPASRRADPQSVARALAYAAKVPSAAVGYRNRRGYRLACVLTRDFSLSVREAWRILSSWNERNRWPLDSTELRSCLNHAQRYARRRPGCKLSAPPGSGGSGREGDPREHHKGVRE